MKLRTVSAIVLSMGVVMSQAQTIQTTPMQPELKNLPLVGSGADTTFTATGNPIISHKYT